jgi:hypothetical protein
MEIREFIVRRGKAGEEVVYYLLIIVTVDA